MQTLLNRHFKYVSVGPGKYVDGHFKHGGVSVRNVRGTVQTINAQDAAPYADGSRNLGFVKIYASEKLDARKEGGSPGGFVVLDGNFYQILDEMPNLNDIISHYKYIAGLVDYDHVPAEVSEAVG